MSAQKHIIKRQTIELTTRDSAEARRLQNQLGRLYRQRILPLIDRYCTELSQPDRLHRIDRCHRRRAAAGTPGRTSAHGPVKEAVRG